MLKVKINYDSIVRELEIVGAHRAPDRVGEHRLEDVGYYIKFKFNDYSFLKKIKASLPEECMELEKIIDAMEECTKTIRENIVGYKEIKKIKKLYEDILLRLYQFLFYELLGFNYEFIEQCSIDLSFISYKKKEPLRLFSTFYLNEILASTEHNCIQNITLYLHNTNIIEWISRANMKFTLNDQDEKENEQEKFILFGPIDKQVARCKNFVPNFG